MCTHTRHGRKRGTVCGADGKQHGEEEDEVLPGVLLSKAKLIYAHEQARMTPVVLFAN